jgi:TATA-box binding protein (TBP) (component of TFIID and TFIIIB)
MCESSNECEGKPEVKNYKISFPTEIKGIRKILRCNVKKKYIKFYHNFTVVRKKYVYIIFDSGYCNVTKISRKKKCERAIKYLYDFILKVKRLKVRKYQIDNITASGKFEFKLDLEKIRQHYLKRGFTVGYNPDQFAGASIRFMKGTINLFHTGTFTIVGAKKKKHFQGIYNSVRKNLLMLNNGERGGGKALRS